MNKYDEKLAKYSWQELAPAFDTFPKRDPKSKKTAVKKTTAKKKTTKK